MDFVEGARQRRASKTQLSSLLTAIKTVFNPQNKENSLSLSRDYKVYVHPHMTNERETKSIWNSKDKKPSGNTLSFWCFSSGVAMKGLIEKGCRSVVLTSGTLSPLDSFAAELGIEFEHRLENPHVIQPDQIFVGVVPKGPSGNSLNSSYKNRSDHEYQSDLGHALINFCKTIPDGILVFFASYGIMESCIRFWQASVNTQFFWLN